MSKNIMNQYLEFKERSLFEYCKLIYQDSDYKFVRDESFKRYITTYLNTYYCHVLGTLDHEEVKKYNYSVILKELNGMKLELLYELNNNELLEDYDTYTKKQNIIKTCHDVMSIPVKLDMYDFSDCSVMKDYEEKVIELFSKNRFLSNQNIITELISFVKKNVQKEKRFLQALKQETFVMEYIPLSEFKDHLLVDINYKIPKLSNYYKENTIHKIYNSSELCIQKTQVLIQMLQIELLQKRINQENIPSYYILVGEPFFQKKEYFEQFSSLIHSCFKEQICLVLTFNTYNSHKGMLKHYIDKHNFSCFVDMSHILDVEKKLDSVFDIRIFQQVIVEKVKDKDYNAILNYEPELDKQLFILKSKKERVVM